MANISSRITLHTTTFQILKESITLIKNSNHLLPIIVLLNFLSSSFLFILFQLVISPFFKNLASEFLSINFATNSQSADSLTAIPDILAAIRNNIRELSIIEFIFLTTSFFISSFFSVAIIYVLSSTYSGKPITFSDLLSKLKRSTKGLLITQLYVGFLSACYTLLVLLPIIMFLVISYYDSIVYTTLSVLLLLLALLLYLWFLIAWFVSMVVAVVEEGCYGLEAIVKAAEILRGRRRQGLVVVLIEFVLIVVLQVVFSLAMTYDAKLSALRLVIEIVFVAASVVEVMFILAVNTVFYYDCKKTHGEKGEIPVEGSFAYYPLTSTERGALGVVVDGGGRVEGGWGMGGAGAVRGGDGDAVANH